MEATQLTEGQAIAIAKSEIWKNWSNEDIVKFQLFQNRLCMDFSRFHEAVEAVLCRPVWTHEFGSMGGLKEEYLGKKTAPSFEEIMSLIPEDKRVLVVAD